MDRVVSPDGLYTVQNLFHLVPAILRHHGPPGSNKCCFYPFDPIWDLAGAMWSEWSVLIAFILFHPCSSLFQPHGTMSHQDPINALFDSLDPVWNLPFCLLDPVWDLPGTTFGHLKWCNVVGMVSPDCMYTVPILFHLVPAILGHPGPSGPNKCCFYPFDPVWDLPGTIFGH